MELDTEKLVSRAVDTIEKMPRIDAPRIRVTAGSLSVNKGGVTSAMLSAGDEKVITSGTRPLPDLLAYLQNETELTRATIVRILKASNRLKEFFFKPPTVSRCRSWRA